MCVFSPVIMLAVLTAVFPLGRLADPATRDWSFTMGTAGKTKILEITSCNCHFWLRFSSCKQTKKMIGCLWGLTEVGVIHGLTGCQPSLVVVAQKLVKEIQSLRADQVLVLTVDKPFPPLTRMPEIKNTFKDTDFWHQLTLKKDSWNNHNHRAAYHTWWTNGTQMNSSCSIQFNLTYLRFNVESM